MFTETLIEALPLSSLDKKVAKAWIELFNQLPKEEQEYHNTRFRAGLKAGAKHNLRKKVNANGPR